MTNVDKRGMQNLLPGTGPLFLVTYDFTESGVIRGTFVPVPEKEVEL